MSIFGIVDYIIAFDYLLIQTDSAFMRKSRNANINFRNHKNFSIGVSNSNSKVHTCVMSDIFSTYELKKRLMCHANKMKPTPP